MTLTLVPVSSCAFLVMTLQGEMMAMIILMILEVMLENVKIRSSLKAKNSILMK